MLPSRRHCVITLHLLMCSWVITEGKLIQELASDTNNHPRLSKDLPKTLPCPDPDEIEPCVCNYDGAAKMDMDCSKVASEDELRSVFSKDLPFTNFRSLKIQYNNNIKTLDTGDLGSASFRYIFITDSALTKITDAALTGSQDTLEILDLKSNRLASIPSIEDFSKLTYLDVSNNTLLKFPVLSSDTLQHLDLSKNDLAVIQNGVIAGLPSLQILYLQNNSIQEIPEGIFSNNDHLEKLILNNNRINVIAKGAIKLHGRNSELELNENELAHFSYSDVPGVTGYVSLRKNFLTTLPEGDFKPFIQDNIKIYLEGNPFDCDCDIAWLVLDETYLEWLTSYSYPTCFDGQYFIDLDLSYYRDNCL